MKKLREYNKEDLMDKAYAFAYEFEQKYGCCPQCVLAAVKETIGGISDEVFQSSQGLAGGGGLMGVGTCGALSGGMMAISAFFGRDYEIFKENLPRKAFKLSKDLFEKFYKEYGEFSCKGVQSKVLGRSFDMWSAEELKKFYEYGGHEDKCPSVAGNVAKWVIEILHDTNDSVW